MNKFSKFFALAAAVAFVGCNSDEPAMNPDNNPGDGEKLYMNIAIRDAAAGRAGEFELGSGNESVAKDARFFFFDENGIYVGQSNYAPVTDKPNQDPGSNIEFKGAAVVVLTVQSKERPTYPKYMVTLINVPDNKYTEAEMQGKDIKWFNTDKLNWGSNTNGGFIMSTSSYFKGGYTDADGNAQDIADHNDTYYYANELKSSDFALTPEAAKSNPALKVYVERLASRISLAAPAMQEIKVNIQGLENDDLNPDGYGTTSIWVEVTGWGLYNTLQESYLSKQLKVDDKNIWNSATNFNIKGQDAWVWNSPANRRSYWGHSTAYGLTFEQAKDLYNPNPGPAKLTLKAGDVDYCNENTNTMIGLGNGKYPNQKHLTVAVVKAKAYKSYTDANNNEPLKFVEYNGLHFTEDGFKAYILKNLASKNKLEYYTVAGAGTDADPYVYTQVDASMFKLGGDNSHVYVMMDPDKFPKVVYDGVEVKGALRAEASTATLDADLKEINEGKETLGTTTGDMTYVIPVAHENAKAYDENGDLTVWGEGSFGMVRNHAYQVNIKTITRLGDATFNPGSETDPVPVPDNPKDPRWYLGAEINILSWKIVNNNVDL